MKPTKQEYQRARFRAVQIKQLLFFGFLAVMGFIGLLWFARPETSTVEKRDLTKFPKLTLAGLWDGSFCSGVDTWYADTYPLREGLIDMDIKLEHAYGIRSEQIINNGEKADAIPTGTVDLEALAGRNTTEAPVASTENTAPKDSGSSPADTGDSPATTQAAEPVTTEYNGHGAGDVTHDLEKAGTIYIADGAGYGVYYFNESNSARYCLLVNKLAKNLAGKAQVYSMLCPISAGVMLSDEVRESTGASDEHEATEWFYRNMDPSVRTVTMMPSLKAHNDEYIFFRTDHHWTALGAYYAYREWAAVKGVTPHELSFFEKTYEFDGFLGTFYTNSNKNASLAANPDTVYAYVPNGTNKMNMFVANNDGTFTEYGWRIVNDVSNYNKTQLYAAFAGGDQAYNYVHNEAVTDGSSVLIVKDSYGNAFIPYLIDHYEYIYWIDFRNYKKWCGWAGYSDPSISNLVERKGIQDVILCHNISIAGSSSALDVMEGIYK